MATPASPEIRAVHAAWLVVIASASAVAVDGFLMLLVGASSFFPDGSAAAIWVPPALALGGALVALLGTLMVRSRLGRAIPALLPRLFPLGPAVLQFGLFVLILVGVVSVAHGFFDVFTSAHAGGNFGSIQDQSDLDSLLIAGSVVVWLLTGYTIAVIARTVRMGRAVAARAGPDVYGRVPDPSDGPGPRIPANFVAPPAAIRLATPTLFAITIALAIAVSAGIQILEVDVQPAPPLDWLAAQVFAPIWAVATAAGLRGLDGVVRQSERQYVAAVRGEPVPTTSPGGSAPATPSEPRPS